MNTNKKLEILEHELNYYKNVYPKSNKIRKLKRSIYYYKKKLV